jgi:succinyl-diaminopimelate desuccinylase
VICVSKVVSWPAAVKVVLRSSDTPGARERVSVMEMHVREAEIVDLLAEMIRAPTVNPPADTRACADILMRVLQTEGIEAELIEGSPGVVNVVARMRGDGSGKTLLLNGHIDTVPPGEQWTVDPFSGMLRDGMLYGRGSCDMKSGVATMLMAMVGLKRSGASFNGEIILQAVADEETGSQYGTRFLLEQDIGTNADFAICTEPTSLRVELGNRGLRWIDVTVTGRASHAGRPQLGRNAITCAGQLIAAIEAIEFSARNDAFEIPTPSISVTTISGGHTVNVIPESCVFSIDRRMIPGETGDLVMEEIAAAFEPVRHAYPDIDIRVAPRAGYWDPYLIDVDEPVVAGLVAGYRAVIGDEPEIGSKAACTDASHLVNMAGIPTVLFGPGNERLSHKPDECVSVEHLVKATGIYISTVRALLGATGPN